MIMQALEVLLIGMLGIFLVMAIIYGVIVALARISRKLDAAEIDADAGEVTPVDVDAPVVVLPDAEAVGVGTAALAASSAPLGEGWPNAADNSSPEAGDYLDYEGLAPGTMFEVDGVLYVVDDENGQYSDGEYQVGNHEVYPIDQGAPYPRESDFVPESELEVVAQ